MELLLNLAWLVIGLSLVALGLHYRRDRASVHPTWAIFALVLTCVIVLLFPVISATDDLHSAPLVADESSNRIFKFLSGVDLSATPFQLLAMLAALLLSAALAFSRHGLSSVHEGETSRGFRRLSFGRAPPAFQL